VGGRSEDTYCGESEIDAAGAAGVVGTNAPSAADDDDVVVVAVVVVVVVVFVVVGVVAVVVVLVAAVLVVAIVDDTDAGAADAVSPLGSAQLVMMQKRVTTSFRGL
jgi:hypothetical protein